MTDSIGRAVRVDSVALTWNWSNESRGRAMFGPPVQIICQTCLSDVSARCVLSTVWGGRAPELSPSRERRNRAAHADGARHEGAVPAARGWRACTAGSSAVAYRTSSRAGLPRGPGFAGPAHATRAPCRRRAAGAPAPRAPRRWLFGPGLSDRGRAACPKCAFVARATRRHATRAGIGCCGCLSAEAVGHAPGPRGSETANSFRARAPSCLPFPGSSCLRSKRSPRGHRRPISR